MQRYRNRVALITGAGQGLGRAVAERLAREGATLALCDINPGTLRDVKETLSRDTGATVDVSTVDVSHPNQVHAWVSATLQRFGAIDVLITNAGIIRDARTETMTDQDWHAVLDVSLSGTFYCCRAALATMKERRYGRILSFASMSWRGNFGQANYTAAKAGIVGLARTIALEAAPYGITSNAIAPGLIDTPMLASMNAAAREKLARRIPARHIGDPIDIAEAAGYLCSEAAGYVTGVVLDVDGGISIGSALR